MTAMTFCNWKREVFQRSWEKPFEDEDWKATAWQNICREESGTLKQPRCRFLRRSCRWNQRRSRRIRWRDLRRNGFRGNCRENIWEEWRGWGSNARLEEERVLWEWTSNRLKMMLDQTPWKLEFEFVTACWNVFDRCERVDNSQIYTTEYRFF